MGQAILNYLDFFKFLGRDPAYDSALKIYKEIAISVVAGKINDSPVTDKTLFQWSSGVQYDNKNPFKDEKKYKHVWGELGSKDNMFYEVAK
jgi:hypothetical protein